MNKILQRETTQIEQFWINKFVNAIELLFISLDEMERDERGHIYGNEIG